MSTRKKKPTKPQTQQTRTRQASKLLEPEPSRESSPPSASDRPAASYSNERMVVPLAEETLQVEKQWIEAGVVEVRKTVETRTETLPFNITHEEVEIEHVPVNRAVTPGEEPRPRQEGDVWIIPVVEEELVVTKHQIVREEVRIRKKQVVTQEQLTDTVKREDLSIQLSGNLTPISEETSRQAENG